eukprot:CAMPEP_0113465242 /NCGR_PEP_ID=MMETSP0014_2-20120614/13635_1 /TAXON_ID=2857 /ORGANISM="Nitzschia sp." /LENGTH=218 /DNA_ID=CAMNT_0000357387 /DNA_START=105 /DNA_END=761 /DNA_ORIENTATION=+ /assembly_acc=CAM_ASM_000159
MKKRRLSSTTATTTKTATESSESFADLLELQFGSFTEDELVLVAVAILVLLILCAVGVVTVFYQCRRLQRTVISARQRRQKRIWEQERQLYHHRRRNHKGQVQGLGRGGCDGATGRDYYDDDGNFVVQGTTKERLNDERRHNVQVQQELLSELQEMKQVHTELQGQVTMLQKFCALKYRPLPSPGQPTKGHDRIVTSKTGNEEHKLLVGRNDLKKKGD